MSKATSIWDLPTSPASYANWALRLKRACSRRTKRALRTAAGDCSFWPTPTAADAGCSPDLILADATIRLASAFDRIGKAGKQYSLGLATRNWTMLWLILQAVGWNAQMAACRSLPPVRVTFRGGQGSFANGLISNPRFCEMLMGWPINWTAPEQPVTEFAAWLQRSRGQLSKLLTNFEPDPLSI